MAKKKVKFELKQDVLAECNDRIRDRLFNKPFNLKPKNFLFIGKVDIEVVDPSWNKKAIERSLYLNIKRSMQLVSVRLNTILQEYDDETDFRKQGAKVGKLKNAALKNGKEVAEQAEYNLEQIIDDITKDVAKWGKAGDTLKAMKAIDKGDKDLEKTVGRLEKSLKKAAEDIKGIKKAEPDELRKHQKTLERKLSSNEEEKTDALDDYNLEKKDLKESDKAAFEKKLGRISKGFEKKATALRDGHVDDLEKFKNGSVVKVKGFVKEAGVAFSSYRKERGEFHKILKETAKKMHKMVDSKSTESKAIAQIQDMLKKKVKPAAEAYSKYLNDCDDDIMDVIGRLGGNKVSPGEIEKALPDSKSGNALFREFKAVKDHMKRERIQ